MAEPTVAELQQQIAQLQQQNTEARAKIDEFRDRNVKLTKDIARFDGIDPDAVKADRAKLAEFESAKPNEKIAALQSQLDEANRRANGAVLKDAVVGAFLKAGGQPSAADYIMSKAEKVLAVENGVVVGTAFNPLRPGEKIDIAGFLQQQLSESAFAFKASSGSGADGRSGGGTSGHRAGVKVLRNPDARQLGEAGDQIRRGEVRVVYDE